MWTFPGSEERGETDVFAGYLRTDSKGGVFQVLEGVVYYVDPTTSSDVNICVCWQQRACTCYFIGKALLLAGICKDP